MAEDVLLSPSEIEQALSTLPDWECRDDWLRRKYATPGFTHTMLLVNTIGYLAEAAWHHPDLSVGYAQVTVKLQTHRVRGVTASDVELARQIEKVATWLPPDGAALQGFPKKWVH